MSLAPVLLTSGALSQPEGPNISARIVAAIVRGLKPADLRLSLHRLQAKLDRAGTGLFYVTRNEQAWEKGPMPALSRVEESRDEVMAVLWPDQKFDAPRLTYWIGVRNGRIAARAIPRNPDFMLGPMYGHWRRHGRYLVGVGYDDVYHEQSWGDGEIYVFDESGGVPKLIQREHILAVRVPCGFVGSESMTIDCRHEIWGNGYEQKYDFKTLHATKSQESTVDDIWTFQHGRYVHTRTIPVHDILWAADRLMTAVRLGNGAVVRAMIPDSQKRRAYVKILRSALRAQALRPDSDDKPLTLWTYSPKSFRIRLDLRSTRTGWILRRATHNP